MSLTCGIPAVRDDSGMFVFRGGGGGGVSEYGLYAVLVCIFRFEDVCAASVEENCRRKVCWQGRENDDNGTARLKTKLDEGEAKGPSTRGADIF